MRALPRLQWDSRVLRLRLTRGPKVPCLPRLALWQPQYQYTRAMAISKTASIPSEFQPRVSKGHDQDQVRNEAAGLVSVEVKGTRRWHLTQDGQGLERVFRFKTFKATWVSILLLSLVSSYKPYRQAGKFGSLVWEYVLHQQNECILSENHEQITPDRSRWH